MTSCPKCLVPNDDGNLMCTACGAALPQAAMAAPSVGAGAIGTGAGAMTMPMSAGVVAVDAQSEINRYYADQAAKRRQKTLIYSSILVVLIAVAAFFQIKSRREAAKREEVAAFFGEFRRVDEGPFGEFWRCVVRAKGMEVRLAPDMSVLTNGLEQAFRAYPKGQPDHIRQRCVPLLEQTAIGMSRLTLPSGFAEPIALYQEVLQDTKRAFTNYATKLEGRKQQAANEGDVLAASAAFHGGDVADVAKSAGYGHLLICAVPDLTKKLQRIEKAPDSQPVVQHVYETCKADPTYAEKLRTECFSSLQEIKKTPEVALVIKKMAGDDRDRFAIEDCFRRANKGFSDAEMAAIGKAWVKYRNEARQKIMEEVEKYKADAE